MENVRSTWGKQIRVLELVFGPDAPVVAQNKYAGHQNKDIEKV